MYLFFWSDKSLFHNVTAAVVRIVHRNCSYQERKKYVSLAHYILSNSIYMDEPRRQTIIHLQRVQLAVAGDFCGTNTRYS